MRAARLALFGIGGLAVVLLGLALAIGWRPFQSVPVSPTSPPASTTESLPTVVPEPTLTAAERAVFNSMSIRADSMVKATRDLRALGQEIRATALWKGKVQSAVLIITGGQTTIQQAALPAHYGPLKDRVKTVTDACAATVTGLPDANALTIAAVAAITPQLEVCERDLKRLQLSAIGS